MGLHRARRFDARGSSNGGDNDVGATHCLGGGFGGNDAAAAPARNSFSPSAFGNNMSQADIRPAPASRKPAAMAWPASPKPMNARVGFAFGIVLNPSKRIVVHRR
jgi:hypothetical protein